MKVGEIEMTFDKEYYEKIGKGYEFTIGRQKLMQEYFSLLSKRMKGKEISRILDVGCAYGYFLSMCEKEHILETIGIEVSAAALEIAKNVTKAKLYNVNIENNNAPFPDGYFDVVTGFAVVEHVVGDAHFLREVYRVLRKGGICFLVTPNGNFWLRRVFKKGEDPTHVNVRDAKYWRRKLAEVGFINLEVEGCLMHGFPPLENIRKRFEKYNLASHKLIFCPILAFAQRLFIFAER